MAEFKKLSAVEAVEAVSDTANVLIEENGVIKKAPKDEVGTDMKKLSAVETVESVSDTANVLIEENGVIKKAPKTAVGGGGGFSNFDKNYYIITLRDSEPAVFVTDGLYQALVAYCEEKIPINIIVSHLGTFLLVQSCRNETDYIILNFHAPYSGDIGRVYPDNTAIIRYED